MRTQHVGFVDTAVNLVLAFGAGVVVVAALVTWQERPGAEPPVPTEVVSCSRLESYPGRDGMTEWTVECPEGWTPVVGAFNAGDLK